MSAQQKAYEAIIGDLYQGAFDNEAWDRGLTGLARLVGGEGPLLISLDPTGAVTRSMLYSYDPQAFAAYATYWGARDPRIALTRQVDAFDVVTQVSVLDRAAWEATPIFNEYLKPNDAPYSLPCKLRADSEKFTFIAIQATRERGIFDRDDAIVVQPLMPHVRRALEIKDRLERHRLCADTVGRVLDSASISVVMLDEDRRVLEASSGAVSALQTVGASVRVGQLLVLPPAAQRELSALLAPAFSRVRASDGFFSISRGHQRWPISILVAPAPVTLQPWIASSPRWMVFIFDPERRLIPAATLLESELGLSSREAEVVCLLASGLDLSQVARRLSISPHTARAHLKSSLGKTGARTQVELLKRVMNSAAWSQASNRTS